MRLALAAVTAACGSSSQPSTEAPAPAPIPPPAMPVGSPDASLVDAVAPEPVAAAGWRTVDCGTLVTPADLVAVCKTRRKLPAFAIDASERVESAGSRNTCERTLELDGGELTFHLQVIDHGSVEAREGVVEVWRRSFPAQFRDGMHIQEQHRGWTRHDVEGYAGSLGIGVWENDQPGHGPLCTPAQLIELVRLALRRVE